MSFFGQHTKYNRRWCCTSRVPDPAWFSRGSITSSTFRTTPRGCTLGYIPGEGKERTGESGGASMVRVCSGNELPHGEKDKFYMLRSFGNSAHEMWDVTNPAKPSRINVIVAGLRDTHKSWWECDTGI